MSRTIADQARVNVLGYYQAQVGFCRLNADIHKADDVASRALTRMAYRFRHWYENEQNDPAPVYELMVGRLAAYADLYDTLPRIEALLHESHLLHGGTDASSL